MFGVLNFTLKKGYFGHGNGGLLPPEPLVSKTNNCDFQCVSRIHECIDKALVCDGEFDCTDGSDEFSCRKKRDGETNLEFGALFCLKLPKYPTRFHLLLLFYEVVSAQNHG